MKQGPGANTDDPKMGVRLVKWVAWITCGALVWLVFVAQYDAWNSERDKLEIEIAKNKQPDIRGEFFNVSLGACPSNARRF
jgi:hypothetical protein